MDEQSALRDRRAFSCAVDLSPLTRFGLRIDLGVSIFSSWRDDTREDCPLLNNSVFDLVPRKVASQGDDNSAALARNVPFDLWRL